MEIPVSSQFVILGLHPEKGRVVIDNVHFRYALTGAVLMDFLDNGEITLSDNKLIPASKKTGDLIHDLFNENFEGSSRPRRISYWIRRMARKYRFIFRENINSLISKGIIRHERRFFLNIFPYNRYFQTDSRIRAEIINGIREILFHDKQATRKQGMLIGLINASGSSRLLAKEKAERRILRRKCRDFKQNDPMASEIDKTIRDIQTAIAASVAAASVAASSSH